MAFAAWEPTEDEHDRFDAEESVAVDDIVGAAAFLCPPSWASNAELDRSATAVAEFADGDQDLVSRACRTARRRFAAGHLQRSVVRLLELAVCVSGEREGTTVRRIPVRGRTRRSAPTPRPRLRGATPASVLVGDLS